MAREMDVRITIEILIASILIALGAFFSGSETALIAVNKIRIRYLADAGNKNALILVKLLEKPEEFLTAILIGNNIVNITASVLAADIALQFFGSKGIAIATGVMTLAIIVIGEVFPKTFASRHSESISLHLASHVRLFVYILRPIIWILTVFINLLITIPGGKERIKNPFVTEDVIKMMLKVGEREGTIEKHEREIIHNVFEFSDRKAIDVMTPKEKMACIDGSNTLDSALALINESGHSRIPVYRETCDNIIGMIYAKDFLKFRDYEFRKIKVNQILRPVLTVKAGRKISSIIKELQQKKMNISVVADENMKIIGLVSIEDILEELVGEIFDEYDIEIKIGV
jgi:putative hemolysin